MAPSPCCFPSRIPPHTVFRKGRTSRTPQAAPTDTGTGRALWDATRALRDLPLGSRGTSHAAPTASLCRTASVHRL